MKKTHKLEARSGPEVVKLFSCSKHFSMKYVIFINITISLILSVIYFYLAHGLSMVFFITLGPDFFLNYQ